MARPVQVVAPTSQPVSLSEMKSHLVVTDDERDALIHAYIAAATEKVERLTRRAIMPQTWEWSLDAFPGVYPARLTLPIGPVMEVEEIVTLSLSGAETILGPATYRVETGLVGRVEPLSSWPSTDLRQGAVRVRWVAGDGACPPSMKAAIMLLVGHLFANREAVVIAAAAEKLPLGVESLLEHHRVFR